MPTADFIKIYNQLPEGITIIQIDKLPPQLLNLDNIKGKSRYDILVKECAFLFEIDIKYPTDYSEITSKDKIFLEQLLSNPKIDWNNID